MRNDKKVILMEILAIETWTALAGLLVIGVVLWIFAMNKKK